MENSENKTEKKKPMSHEERLAVATKLDKELDDFILNLRKGSTQKTGQKTDNQRLEMEKHQFFMTTLPDDGKSPPLLEVEV